MSEPTSAGAAAPLPPRLHALPPPGRLHTVDGLRLHLRRSGPEPRSPQAPTVVIEAGAGVVSPVYARLQEALAARWPVCSHDRPGLGWSDPCPEPLDGLRHARRLRALLAAAGVRGPLVLVGHSLGGLLNRVYAGLYPDQVAGLLMLDASHPEQFEQLGGALGAQVAALQATERARRVAFREGGAPPPEVAMVEALFADMPEVIAQVAATWTPEGLDAMVREMQGIPQVARQAAAVRDLGDRPLAVLWAAPRAAGADGGLDVVQQRWPLYQRSHAALSSRGTERELVGADHMGIAVLPPFVAQVAAAVDGLMAQLA